MYEPGLNFLEEIVEIAIPYFGSAYFWQDKHNRNKSKSLLAKEKHHAQYVLKEAETLLTILPNLKKVVIVVEVKKDVDKKKEKTRNLVG